MLVGLLALSLPVEMAAQELDLLFSPGPLSSAHSHLSGLRNCSSCHTPGTGVEEGKCLGCHQELASRMREGKGFHRDKADECWACHYEHQGQDVAIVDFDESTFDHRETGTPLTGLHLQVADCEECHKSENAPPREKTKTFFLNDIRCVACHEDVHRGQLDEDCASCHPLGTNFRDIRFDHDLTRYPLSGAHGNVPCRQCHAGGRWTGLAFSRCLDCHSDSHRPQLDRNCERCHNSSSWRVAAFDHDRTRYPLRGMHRAVACEPCHESGQFKGVAFTRCDDCHEADPHAGQFAQDCSRCHNVDGFGTALFDHDDSLYRLTGRHTSVSCDRCHLLEDGLFPDGQAAAVRYRPLPELCADCHEDVHLGQLTSRCDDCHTTTGFGPDALLFDHATDSRYPLLGRHSEVSCYQCHETEEDTFPAAFGRTVRYRPLSDNCTACHANVHDPDRSADDDTDCTRCHTYEAFTVQSFDHDSTSFHLTGEHRTSDCEGCHELVDWNGRSILSLTTTPGECAACHHSPHSGQLERCAECHTTRDWSVRPW